MVGQGGTGDGDVCVCVCLLPSSVSATGLRVRSAVRSAVRGGEPGWCARCGEAWAWVWGGGGDARRKAGDMNPSMQ
jgi:hypothetical protein